MGPSSCPGEGRHADPISRRPWKPNGPEQRLSGAWSQGRGRSVLGAASVSAPLPVPSAAAAHLPAPRMLTWRLCPRGHGRLDEGYPAAPDSSEKPPEPPLNEGPQGLCATGIPSRSVGKGQDQGSGPAACPPSPHGPPACLTLYTMVTVALSPQEPRERQLSGGRSPGEPLGRASWHRSHLQRQLCGRSHEVPGCARGWGGSLPSHSGPWADTEPHAEPGLSPGCPPSL